MAVDLARRIKDYVEERNRAFIALDLDWVRSKLPGVGEEVLLIALHKARYECKDINDALRRESGAWLIERGHHRICGLPITDDLPE